MLSYHLLCFASFALSFSESIVLLIALVLVAIGISIWVYRHTVPEVSRSRRLTLTALRASGLAIILFLLFEPILNLERTEQLTPKAAVLIDNSRSMTIEDGGTPRANAVRDAVHSGALKSVSARGETVPYLFDRNAYPLAALESDSLTFDGSETDISAALLRAQEDLAEKNLRSVVLVTDGNFTSGKNPLYSAEALGVPVHVVAVGDSAEKKDLLVSRVLANSITYVENVLPVDATVRSAGFDGGTAEVVFREGTTVLDRKSIPLQSGVNEYPVSFSYTATSDGMKKLSVEVTPQPGELTRKNNRQDVFVRVLKVKMKIVLIAGAPSPDVALVKQVFRKDKNVAVTEFIQKFGNTWYGNEPTAKAFQDAECIFLVGYPLKQSGSGVLSLVKTAVEKQDVPLFILPSRETDLGRLKSALDAYLPFDIVQTRMDETQAFIDLTPEAKQSAIVTSGIPEEAWRRLPPLFRTESSFKPRVGAQTLGTMKINNIPLDEPLLLSRRINRSKVIAFTGYGLWRWQLAFDVMEGKLPSALIGNSVRWLTTRDDAKRVRIRPVKQFFDTNEKIEFTGQVYNENYEPLEGALVRAVIKGPQGEQELILSPQGAGRYAGALDPAGEGDYSYKGTAAMNGNEIGSDNGRFHVGELNVEFQQTRMNNILLRQIAAKSGGVYMTISDIGRLEDAIAAQETFTPRTQVLRSDIQLWNLVWLLALAVLLFAIEWYLRKQSGMI